VKRYAAFLRGINVGGQKIVRMAELRERCLADGLVDVETYIQSGNIVFSCEGGGKGGPAARISALIRDAWGFDVAVIAKDAEDMARIVGANPFARAGGCDIKAMYATLLERPPLESQVEAMVKSGKVRERFEIIGDTVYTCYAQGYGKSDFSNNYIERALAMAATTRNWTTMLRVEEMTRS
jgi:uncharacterized protein (DUF1697 family)